MTAIVKLYVQKIQNGELTIDKVPPRWRAEVERELEKLNNEE